jgi:Winged helix DNA-binding domain
MPNDMNVTVLIDSIVRQTTVLIAQLATTAGVRAPLAHVANQVFIDLTKELREQGVGQKVIADMFGMALRTYHAKVRRLSGSENHGGHSLWEAVLEHAQDKGPLLRADLMTRFRNDDSAAVRAVLRDLVDSGMLFRSGQGEATIYRAATAEELRLGSLGDDRAEGILSLVWVAVNRYAPATAADLAQGIPLDEAETQRALDGLVGDGRVQVLSGADGVTRYECTSCVIPLESAAGWEAAVFDHFQAMVTAVCTKLRLGTTIATKKDWVGGSTYGFDVWDGHPHQAEVVGFLAAMRERAVALRTKVEAYNGTSSTEGVPQRVLVYVGQTVMGIEPEGATE